jgi:membrane-bound metal-dependent hydrolase YbcI (DUF457 family)
MGPPGHFAIGLAAKPAAPKGQLWLYLVASEFLDILSYVFESLGLERFAVTKMDFQNGLQIISPGSVPWSHSMLISIIWSLLAAGIIFMIYREKRTSAVVGLLVFSHWMLDFIVHPPDLHLLFKNSPQVGLGLWNSGPGFILSIILELVLFAAGLYIFLNYRSRNKIKAIQQTPRIME